MNSVSIKLLMRLTLTIVLMVYGGACATEAAPASADYQRADSVKVMRLLRHAPKGKTTGQTVLHFARALKGLPYVGKTLEKNANERLVINLRQLDCTTYVETVLALTQCVMQGRRTFEAFCDNLRQLRYLNGKIAYENRLHYFTSWIDANQRRGAVEDICKPNPPFSAVQTVKVDYMTTHQSLYPMFAGHPERVKAIADMEKAITGSRHPYIPKTALANSRLLRQTIHDGDVIVILTSKKGLDTSHLGIAVWHKDGLHLLNASSIHHKVVEEPMLLSKYMARQASRIGIRVVRLK